MELSEIKNNPECPPVFILIRTSARPIFFSRCMQSVKKQTYPNIITIVHRDDPGDEYIEGDIIIRSKREPYVGNGHFNLYCNKLLETIPEGIEGWYHFIDDDDEYYDENVIENLVKNAKRDCINVARVQRWHDTVFPRDWGTQKSYQTECFFLHTDHKDKARWWSKKGGDHNYSRQLTAIMPVNWIDNLIIAKAQKGKGHGSRYDADFDGEVVKTVRLKKTPESIVDQRSTVSTCGNRYKNEKLVVVYYIRRVVGKTVIKGKAGEKKFMPLHYAEKLLNQGKVKIIDYDAHNNEILRQMI